MENAGITHLAERRASLAPTLLLGAAVVAVAVVFMASSSWYATFKAVHVLFAVIWVGGAFLLTLLGLVAERTNDPSQLAAVAKQAALVGEKLFAPASLITFAMGIALMLNTDWGWNHFWIVAGLVGFASTFVVGVGVLTPMSKRLHALMDAKGPNDPDTQAAISRILLVARFDAAVLLLVIVDMVVKPFSS